MKIPAFKPLPLMIAILLSNPVNADEPLEIEDAWIAEAPPVARVMAAYMEIENDSDQPRRAVALDCQAFERTEFHRTVEKDGIARMEHQPVLEIPAGSELALAPGGLHVMLFNPERRFTAGDSIDCTMTFDDGTRIAFKMDVKKASAEDHSHHHHH